MMTFVYKTNSETYPFFHPQIYQIYTDYLFDFKSFYPKEWS
jgi:hypothetical protein